MIASVFDSLVASLALAVRRGKYGCSLRGLVTGGGFYGFFQVAADAGFGDVGTDAGLCCVAG